MKLRLTWLSLYIVQLCYLIEYTIEEHNTRLRNGNDEKYLYLGCHTKVRNRTHEHCMPALF